MITFIKKVQNFTQKGRRKKQYSVMLRINTEDGTDVISNLFYFKCSLFSMIKGAGLPLDVNRLVSYSILEYRLLFSPILSDNLYWCPMMFLHIIGDKRHWTMCVYIGKRTYFDYEDISQDATHFLVAFPVI